MNKKEREKLKLKYDGHCAYCGCELNGKWHVDHFEPLVRTLHYSYDSNNRILKDNKGRYITETRITYPERDVIENMMPSCIKCNNDKSCMEIEDWRTLIKHRIHTLNNDPKYASYQKAKKFGLITENDIEVIFFYEKFNKF